MGLAEYRRKRDFSNTTEPSGKQEARTSGRRFVVQKHAASRLHYDFRLEWDGALKSWAVPKGPSLDPAVKALAVQVEDHPLEYATFEGIIPKGEYGGGTVMVWDHGEWEPKGDVARSLKAGRLSFRLYGEKLAGEWSLIQMKDRDAGKNWLLIKKDDQEARANGSYDVTAEVPSSVLTDRSLEEIASDADNVWSSNRKANGKAATKTSSLTPQEQISSDAFDVSSLSKATNRPFPQTLSPQLATAVKTIPQGDDWIHELKFDGYRLLAFLDGPHVRLLTRRGNDWTNRFQALAQALRNMKRTQTILDGEVVVLDSQGISDFQRLQNAMKSGQGQDLVYYVFDTPHFDGFDLTATPLGERKELLARLILTANPSNTGSIRYSDHIRGAGSRVLEQSCRHELEGVVSKKINSRYESRRSRNWVKTKCLGRQEFVIGGFTKPSGSRTAFGALLVGYYEGGELTYCGRVGTGFTEESLKSMGKQLAASKQKSSPFANPPIGAAARGVTWVKPNLIAEVEFSEWTNDGLLRHPSFQGLREDKAAEDVVRDTGPVWKIAAKMPSRAQKSSKAKGSSLSNSIASVSLSSPDRILYPDEEITKLDLARYYERVADWILPFVQDRPLTLVRCPKGRKQKCFFQKHWTESLPDAVARIEIEEKKEKSPYIIINDLAGLISLVQMNALELHPWAARTDRLDRPDKIVFDLDPGEGVAWEAVKQAALEIRGQLTNFGLEAFLRTSGGKGLHVVVPITRRNRWEEVGEFAEHFAKKLAAESPKQYVANMRKQLRQGRIFIDYLRNRQGATSIASYSARARAGAPVAMPVRWNELDSLESAGQWTVETAPARLEQLTTDPWEGFFSVRQSITQKARRTLKAV